MVFPRNTGVRSLMPEAEPIDDFGADEAFLQNVVAPAPVAAPAPAPAPAPFNPADFDWSKGSQIVGDYVYSPVFQQSGSGETLEIGPLINILRTSASGKPGDIGENLDPVTGQVLNRFRTEGESKGFLGDLWSDISSVAADVGPVVQAVPFVGQAVQAINAINAARSGSVLPLVASAAGYGGYSDIANAARAAEAIRKDDYLGAVIPALQAAGISDVGGFSTKDIRQAIDVVRAIERENPLALAGAASAYLPGPSMPGLFVDENIQEGFFDEGGPGYIEPTTVPTSYFPEFDQPLLTAPPPVPTFKPPSDEDYEELESILLRYPEQQIPGVEPKTTIPPQEMASFLEANIEDPGTIDTLMQDYFPELYSQRIEVPGTRDRDFFPEFSQPLLTAEPTPEPIYEQPPTPAPTPAPAPAPVPVAAPPAAAPALAPAAKKKDDLGLLMMLAAMMTPQQKAEEDYQLAQILGVESPFGRIV